MPKLAELAPVAPHPATAGDTRSRTIDNPARPGKGLPRRPSGPVDPVSRWLTAAFSNPRAAVITRAPGIGASWRSEPVAWALERIAEAVHDPDLIVGIRPEGLVRVLWADIDQKPGGSVSPYWHPYGMSRQLQALQDQAEAAGCSCTILRSSVSGGLHCLITLPVALRAWQAHWVGAELLARAGMTEAKGKAELFPSRLDYSDSSNPRDWAQSHGIRLPGQEGSALVVNEQLLADPETIYAELISALDATEVCEGWDQLLAAATDRRKLAARQRTGLPRRCHRPTLRQHGISWTAPGQSHENIKRITAWARAAHPTATTVETLGAAIKEAVVNAPGFRQFASAETQNDVERGWCERWARSSLKRGCGAEGSAAAGGDKHHNKRLFLQSRAALTRVWRRAVGANQWSQRKVSEATGLNRQTVRRHWDYWLQLVSGTPPLLTGGTASGSCQTVPVRINQSLIPAPPVTSAVSESIGANIQTKNFRSKYIQISLIGSSSVSDGPVSPFLPDLPVDPVRRSQRIELLMWLGVDCCL